MTPPPRVQQAVGLPQLLSHTRSCHWLLSSLPPGWGYLCLTPRFPSQSQRQQGPMREPLTRWGWYVGTRAGGRPRAVQPLRVQMSRILGCEKLCTVQHNSLASKSLCDVVSPPLFVCLTLHRSQREGCTVSSFLPLGPSRLSLAKVNVTF